MRNRGENCCACLLRVQYRVFWQSGMNLTNIIYFSNRINELTHKTVFWPKQPLAGGVVECYENRNLSQNYIWRGSAKAWFCRGGGV